MKKLTTPDGTYEVLPTEDGVYLYHQTDTATTVMHIPSKQAWEVCKLIRSACISALSLEPVA